MKNLSPQQVFALFLFCAYATICSGHQSPECIALSDYLNSQPDLPNYVRYDPSKPLIIVIEENAALSEIKEVLAPLKHASILSQKAATEKTSKDIHWGLNIELIDFRIKIISDTERSVKLRKDPSRLGWNHVEYILRMENENWTIVTRTPGGIIF